MAKIKTSGTSSETAVHAEKEIQLARQQAEMKAGEALFRGASQKITEQQEKTQSDNTDTEQTRHKDTAQLSDPHMRPYTDRTDALDENLKWVLEMAGKDWEAFLMWHPDPDMPLSAQLQELSALYLRLLEAALKHAEGDHLAQQIEYLDSLLAQRLNTVIEQNLKPLTLLLERSRNTAMMDGIRSSLYRQTAGRILSPQSAHRLFAQGSPTGRGNTGFLASAVSSAPSSSSFPGKSAGSQPSARQEVPSRQTYQGQRPASSSSFSGEGMIYQSSRKQNIRFQQVYYGHQNSWKEQIRQRKEIIGSAGKGIGENTFHKTGVVSCSAKELETANRFAAHVNGRGNLFQHPEITARNDELTGLLAAIMSIKGQVYAGEAGRTGSLSLILQNAVEKMVDHYLSQKGVTNVYYHTLTVYKKIKDPQKAIRTGQDYAYRQFCEKQKNPAFQKSAPYSRDSGFFRVLLKNLSPEKELALGTNILQKDWENFLRAIGKMKTSSYLSRAEKYSPWGILLEPETHHAGSNGTMIKVLLGITVFILIGILAALFFGAGAW